MAVTGFAAMAHGPGLHLEGSAARFLDAFAHGAPEPREHAFAGVRGTRLHAVSWEPQAEARASVVVVHGLKDHSARYGVLAERLASRRIAVHAFDLRGHGRSGGDRAWVDAFEDYAADLDVFVGLATKGASKAPLFVLGQGMGGAIATLWAIERRAPIAGLLLSAAALRARISGATAWGTRIAASVAPRARVLQLDVRTFSRDRRTVEDALRDGLVHKGPTPARTASELLGALGRIESRAAELDAPLLAMHGTADPVTDPDGSVRLVDRAASADKALRLYDGLAHDLLHEPERDRVMWDAIGWIEQRID